MTKRKLSGALLIIGVMIRGHGLPVSSIWYDEAFSAAITRLPLLEMIRALATDFNPPLWEMILWQWTRISGSLIVLRLPSLIFSICALGLFWLIMDELEFTGNQRLLASALAAFLPGHFLIAQDARVYALLTALYMMAVLFALRGRWLGLTAISGLMLYAHSVSGAFLVGVYLLAWYKHPGQLRMIILSGTVAIISWIPWMPNVLSTAQTFWTAYPLTADYFMMSAVQSVWAASMPTEQWRLGAYILMMFYSSVGVMITISISFPALYRLAAERVHRARAAMQFLGLGKLAARLNPARPQTLDDADVQVTPTALVALIPLIIMILVSLVYANVVFYRPLTVFLLPFALWLGASTAPKNVTRIKMIWPVCWVVLLAAGLIGWNPAAKGGGLENIVRGAIRPGDAIFYVTGTAALPAEYYLDDIPHTAYILDADQHPALLRNALQDALGYTRAHLYDAHPDIIFVPRDPIIAADVIVAVDDYLLQYNARRVGRVSYWQAAMIEIWRIDQ